MPLISVIVPIYKVEPYIRRCVDSILNQTFKEFELILVDDGSPDNCPLICDEYQKKDKRITVIHKKNGGVSSARNAGIVAASSSNSSFLLFVDADDAIGNLTLEKLVNEINNIDSDMIRFNFRYIKETLTIEKMLALKNMRFSIETIDKKNLFLNNFLLNGKIGNSVWLSLFKKEIVEKNGLVFDERISYGEDFLFLFNYISRIKSISLFDEALYNYYVRTDSCVFLKKDSINFNELLLLINSLELLNKQLLDVSAQIVSDVFFYLITIELNKIKPIYEKHNRDILVLAVHNVTQKHFFRKLMLRKINVLKSNNEWENYSIEDKLIFRYLARMNDVAFLFLGRVFYVFHYFYKIFFCIINKMFKGNI